VAVAQIRSRIVGEPAPGRGQDISSREPLHRHDKRKAMRALEAAFRRWSSNRKSPPLTSMLVRLWRPGSLYSSHDGLA